MSAEDYKVLSEAWVSRKWPAHMTYEQIVAQWKHEQEIKAKGR